MKTISGSGRKRSRVLDHADRGFWSWRSRERVTAWQKLAEVCDAHVKRGDRVLVTGTVGVSTWQDSRGEWRATLEVRAETVRFLGGNRNAENHRPTGATPVPDAEYAEMAEAEAGPF